MAFRDCDKCNKEMDDSRDTVYTLCKSCYMQYYLDDFTRWYGNWIDNASIPAICEVIIGIPDYPHDEGTRHAMIAELSIMVNCWSDDEKEVVKKILIANHGGELFLKKMDDWERKNNQ